MDGWYIGPSMEHYRCCKLYFTKTRVKGTANTIEFFPDHKKMPGLPPKETATNADLDLVEALTDLETESLFALVGVEKWQALRKLADIFKRKTGPYIPSREMEPSSSVDATVNSVRENSIEKLTQKP